MSSVAMYGDETVVPVELLDQPRKVYPDFESDPPVSSVKPVVP